MSNPNQANINTFLTGTYSANLTTTFTDIVKNPLNSNALVKVKNISFTNFSETLSATVSVRYFNAAFNNNIFINDKFTIAAKSTRQLISNDISINLNEGEYIQANTNLNNSNVNAVVRFDDLSESTNYTGILASSSYPLTVNYLVVAGGGGGGTGAGGAGGFITGSTVVGSARTEYAITVGGGGRGANSLVFSTSGSNSSIGLSPAITSTGGGYGGTVSPTSSENSGAPGGSGGGGGNWSGAKPGGSGNTPPTSPAQGCPGGSGVEAYAGGGGGGASAAGTNAPSSGIGGVGGDGRSSSISGSPVCYAGGGGGGSTTGQPAKSGGNGGGGAGGVGTSTLNGIPGTQNTGGGGGGAGRDSSSGANIGQAGAGGSGIAILSYPGQQRATGGTITCAAGNTIHTFTSSGNLTFSAFCFFS